MISIDINKICFAGAVASAAVVLASGCSTATASGGLHRTAEVRIATTLEAGNPKLMVIGPARLLHVEVHGRQEVEFYSVKRGADGTIDCAGKARSAVRQLQEAASNELNVAVGEDEGICVANAGAGSATRADVSWHALRGTESPIEVAHTDHASHHVDTKPSLRS